jgi:hypothetical protein
MSTVSDPIGAESGAGRTRAASQPVERLGRFCPWPALVALRLVGPARRGAATAGRAADHQEEAARAERCVGRPCPGSGPRGRCATPVRDHAGSAGGYRAAC